MIGKLRALLLILCFVATAISDAHAEPHRLRVMTFNLWHGGDGGGQSLDRTIEVIRAAKADVVGLQETHGKEVDGVRPDHGQKIADRLGWHYFDQGGRTGVLSRFPIASTTPRKWGVAIEYRHGSKLHFFNAHLAASPYQPYQLLEIPYGDAPFIRTESETIHWARRARGDQVDRLLSELGGVVAKGQPVVLTGDLNEPSHLDWTMRGHTSGCCPIKCEFPSTKRIADVGMRDAFRLTHRDEVGVPGFTWTPTTAATDPSDRHDRIDYVFVSGASVKVQRAQVVGEDSSVADIVVRPWPSDHRAVVAEILISVGDQPQG